MKVYPVVHINNAQQAVEQAGVAFEHGADGVYLIDHQSYSTDQLFAAFNTITLTAKRSFIGVNLLGRTPLQALETLEAAVADGRLVRAPDALWSDSATDESQPGEAIAYRDDSKFLRKLCYRGGVAFKYTEHYTDDPMQAAALAERYRSRVDVVTTSGEGTGHAPSVAKIRAMHNRVGTLAVASGISFDNISNYAGVVDEVLVASSVETEPYSGIFNTPELAAFIARAHEL